MLYAEKIIEEVVQLHNTSTGRIHFMILIKQVLDEQCLGSALSILREVIWGRCKVDISVEYPYIALEYISEAQGLAKHSDTVEEILKIAEESKLHTECTIIETKTQQLNYEKSANKWH